MRPVASLFLFLAMALPASAASPVVDIAFDAAGRFAHSGVVAPGKFIEICGRFKGGQVVEWKFRAPAPTDFNIHYHVGKDVEYPEKRSGIAESNGRFTAPVDQDYCWMWKNTGQADVRIEAELLRK